MYRVTGRVFFGRDLRAYVIDDGINPSITVSTEEFKQYVRQGLVPTCKVQGDTVTGINGFKLKDLPMIQSKTSAKSSDTTVSIDKLILLRNPTQKKQYTPIGYVCIVNNAVENNILESITFKELDEFEQHYNWKLLNSRLLDEIEVKGLQRQESSQIQAKIASIISSGRAVIALDFDDFITRRIAINYGTCPEPSHNILEIISKHRDLYKDKPLTYIQDIVFGETGRVSSSRFTVYKTPDNTEHRTNVYTESGIQVGALIANSASTPISCFGITVPANGKAILPKSQIDKFLKDNIKCSGLTSRESLEEAGKIPDSNRIINARLARRPDGRFIIIPTEVIVPSDQLNKPPAYLRANYCIQCGYKDESGVWKLKPGFEILANEDHIKPNARRAAAVAEQEAKQEAQQEAKPDKKAQGFLDIIKGFGRK